MWFLIVQLFKLFYIFPNSHTKMLRKHEAIGFCLLVKTIASFGRVHHLRFSNVGRVSTQEGECTELDKAFPTKIGIKTFVAASWCGSIDPGTKRLQYDSQSGYRPRLQAQFPGRGRQEAANPCLSLIDASISLFLKINKNICKKKTCCKWWKSNLN